VPTLFPLSRPSNSTTASSSTSATPPQLASPTSTSNTLRSPHDEPPLLPLHSPRSHGRQ
jgi:hypothetical protein